MNNFIKIILYILGILFFMYATTAIMGFFSVGFSTYATYMFWVVALMIFFIVLPGKTSPIFYQK